MECHCEKKKKKGKLLCKATHCTGQQSPPLDRTLHLWPVSQLLYAWRRSRLDRNVAWKFGQYNSKVLFLNPQKRFFHDLYTYHSLQPKMLAVQVLDLQNTGQDMFSMFGPQVHIQGERSLLSLTMCVLVFLFPVYSTALQCSWNSHWLKIHWNG